MRFPNARDAAVVSSILTPAWMLLFLLFCENATPQPSNTFFYLGFFAVVPFAWILITGLITAAVALFEACNHECPKLPKARKRAVR
jgi:hypothetical protein